MTIQSETAPADNAADRRGEIAVRREEVTLPSGEASTVEYAAHGTGIGVIVIPSTIGHRRLLTRSHSHALGTDLWEFPRRLTARDSTMEAERCLFEATGLQATCRRIGTIAPEPGSLTTVYGVYEAFVEAASDGAVPMPPEPELAGARWLDEVEFALAHRSAQIADGTTLAALTLQSIEEATADY